LSVIGSVADMASEKAPRTGRFFCSVVAPGMGESFPCTICLPGGDQGEAGAPRQKVTCAILWLGRFGKLKQVNKKMQKITIRC
jgi:hypothetical protein